MSSPLVFGENVVPAQVVFHFWNHASELMERIEGEIEARALLPQWTVLATKQSHTAERRAFQTLTARSRRHASHERQHQYTHKQVS